MTSRNEQYMLQQQVNARQRFDDQDRSFAEKVAAARRQAIETSVCYLCNGSIVNSVCATCEKTYDYFGQFAGDADESAVTS